jgi:aspartate aminotransferase
MKEKSVIEISQYSNLSKEAERNDLSKIGASIEGSQILKIAYEIKALIDAGQKVLNLTVGDFSPKQFPVPELLKTQSIKYLNEGQTNYPPSDGVPELRDAVVKLYERRLGIRYSRGNIIVQSGGRPGIYATLRALINPGDGIIYTLPSWNTNLYANLVEAAHIGIPVSPGKGFLPTAEDVKAVIQNAKLLCLNSPMNPCGTVIERVQLQGICEVVLEENAKRVKAGKPGVYLFYDQLYWLLTFGDAAHYTPVEVCPEIAPYTILLDGISKGFAATGLRVGWTVVPVHLAPAVRDLIAQMGAWAPKPIQYASADLLNDDKAIDDYLKIMKHEAEIRLQALYNAFETMRLSGLPVRCLKPQGAIYLSAQINLLDKEVVDSKGSKRKFTTNESIRQYLLEEAGFGVVPFGAFGSPEEDGWFRLSVGAVSMADIETGVPRLQGAIERVFRK